MKRNFIKNLTLVIVFASITTSLTACSKKDNATSGTDSSSQTPVVKEVQKPTVIKAILDTTFIIPEAGQPEFLAEFKKQTGIDLQVIQPVHNQYYEKVNLAFASQDVPDVLEIGGAPYLSYASNGALYDMTSLYDKSTVLKSVDKKYTDSLKINGKLYGFPNNAGGGTITYVRKELLDKANVQLPTTYSEFISMLKALKTAQPDIIPCTMPGFISSDTSVPMDIYVREFYQNANPDIYKGKDGKYVDGMAQPEIKSALQRLADAYKDGLIDKEAITNTTTNCRDKFYAGKVGVFNYWAGTWNKTLQDNLTKTVKEANVVPLPALKESKYYERVPVTLAITSACKNPEGVFKYLVEYMHDGADGQMLFTHGVKDLTYKVTDGKYENLPSKNDPKTLFTKSYFSPELSINKWNEPFVLDKLVTNSLSMFNKDSVVASLQPASDVLSKNSADILTLKKTAVSKIVMGEMSVDDGLAKYAKDSKALIDEVLKDLNK